MKTYRFANIPIALHLPFKKYFSSLDAYETNESPRYFLHVDETTISHPQTASTLIQGQHRYLIEDTRITQWYLSDVGEVLYCLEDDFISKTGHLSIQASTDEDTKAEMAYVVSGLWFMDVAVREGYLPLHAGAIQLNHQTIAFMAPSNTGKSTLLTRLMAHDSHAIRLNDDKIFLTLKEDTPWVYSTPFSGQHSLHIPFDGPLDALIVLAQGQDNQLTLFPPHQVLHALLKNTHRPLHPPSYHTLLNTLETLTPKLSLWSYHATNDDRAAKTFMTNLKEIKDAKNRR